MEKLKDIVAFCANYHIFDALTLVLGLVATISLSWRSKKLNSYQMRTYAPTIWTSLGILFTFLSIYLGLLIFEGDDIKQLIKSIIPAFSTSIIGIVGAIISSVRNKKILADKEHDSTRYFNRLREKLGIESDIDADSPELLLFKIISAIDKERESVTSKLETNLSKTNDKSDEFYGKIDNLLHQLDGNTKSSIEEQTSKIQSDFGMVNEQIESTRNSLNTALEIQKKDFLDVIKEMKNAFEGTITTQNGIIERKLISLQSVLDTRIGEMKTTNEGLINRLIDVVQKDLANESEKRNQQLQAFIEKENGEIKQFIEKQEGLYQEIKGNLVNIVSDIRQLFEEDVQKSVEKFAQDQHRLSTTTIAEWNKNLTEKSNEYLKSFEDSIGKLPDAMAKKLDELHEKETELVETTVKDNRTSIDTLLGENKQAVQAAIANLGNNLQNSFDDIKGVITTSIQTNKDDLNGLLKHYIESISAVSTEIKTDNEKIKSELMAAQKGWKETAEDMERKHQGEVIRINEKAQQDILKISDAIIRIESTLQQSLNSIAENITKSISEFNSKQDSIRTEAVIQNEELLQDIREQISKSFQINTLQTATGELVTSINGTLNRFNSETNRITGSLSNVEKSIKESSDKYAEAIRNYDEKINYLGGVIDLFKAHITDMAVLEIELSKLGETLKQTQELANSTAPKKEKPSKQ